jgi:two-component system sensor histidine kinase KdpD
MMDESRPDPDLLLASVRRQEEQARGGRLWIFFGMAAGVGKTYAMLKAAQERLREGVDVVVGIAETHGRAETEALLAGLTIVPRRKLEYRSVVLEEMDLDAILSRKPRLVLVDELAHTNAPGSRHPKRWQDVVELLDAGVDVYSTLNVQHIESRKESVEAITGITIRETVPDSVLERASQIVLIDITPEELLKRLSEGKVYLGDKAEVALRNFFQEDRLTALREIALRLTAETVDNELQTLIAAQESRGVWKPSERLMVAVSHSPYSEGLIRATRRLAFSLDAPWIAVNVDMGTQLSREDRATLSSNLALVRDLGGEVVTTLDVDIAAALKRVARQRGVTQLIVGRPTRRPVRDTLRRGTLVDRLVREDVPFDVHVLHPDVKTSSRRTRHTLREVAPHWPTYGIAAAVVVAVALLSAALLPLLGYRAVGFLFLLAVLSISLFASVGPILLAAVLSALTWDYFFIPPPHTFHISETTDVVMCVAYLVAAAITGTLTHRIRRREQMIRRRENQTQVLYDIVKRLVARTDRDATLRAVASRLGEVLNAECWVIPTDRDGHLDRSAHPTSGPCANDKEWAVTTWALVRRRPVGWSTDTLLAAEALYIPLLGPTEAVGVLALRTRTGAKLLNEEENFLHTIAQQLAIVLERDLLRERAQQNERLKESERLHQTILDSVSHEIRTPLTGIMGAASGLQNGQILANPISRGELVQELKENAERLNRVVGNLLDLSRLESGVLTLRRDWHDPADLVSLAVESTREALANHKVNVVSLSGLPLVRVDISLFEHALTNLLLNAGVHTPAGTCIEIGAKAEPDALVLWISDEGSGIPPTLLPCVFDKFARSPSGRPGGLGIGLSIAKGIVEAHGGRIAVANTDPSGCRFSVRLPLETQPSLPDADSA